MRPRCETIAPGPLRVHRPAEAGTGPASPPAPAPDKTSNETMTFQSLLAGLLLATAAVAASAAPHHPRRPHHGHAAHPVHPVRHVHRAHHPHPGHHARHHAVRHHG